MKTDARDRCADQAASHRPQHLILRRERLWLSGGKL